MLERVRDLIREHRPSIIVIDSFKALRPYAPDAREFRRFLHDLAGTLGVLPITSMWIGEYEVDEIAAAPEFAVADAIIAMGTNQAAERTSRGLRVLKLRGGGFLSAAFVPALGGRNRGLPPSCRPWQDGRLHTRRPPHLVGRPGDRRHGRRRLLARCVNARRGPDRHRQDPDGPALRLRGRTQR